MIAQLILLACIQAQPTTEANPSSILRAAKAECALVEARIQSWRTGEQPEDLDRMIFAARTQLLGYLAEQVKVQQELEQEFFDLYSHCFARLAQDIQPAQERFNLEQLKAEAMNVATHVNREHDAAIILSCSDLAQRLEKHDLAWQYLSELERAGISQEQAAQLREVALLVLAEWPDAPYQATFADQFQKVSVALFKTTPEDRQLALGKDLASRLGNWAEQLAEQVAQKSSSLDFAPANRQVQLYKVAESFSGLVAADECFKAMAKLGGPVLIPTETLEEELLSDYIGGEAQQPRKTIGMVQANLASLFSIEDERSLSKIKLPREFASLTQEKLSALLPEESFELAPNGSADLFYLLPGNYRFVLDAKDPQSEETSARIVIEIFHDNKLSTVKWPPSIPSQMTYVRRKTSDGYFIDSQPWSVAEIAALLSPWKTNASESELSDLWGQLETDSILSRPEAPGTTQSDPESYLEEILGDPELASQPFWFGYESAATFKRVVLQRSWSRLKSPLELAQPEQIEQATALGILESNSYGHICSDSLLAGKDPEFGSRYVLRSVLPHKRVTGDGL